MEDHTQQTTKIPLCDEKIVELYLSRDESAIDETDFKYKKYLFSVAYNILHERLDCEECLNDTYLGAWNSIPPAHPRSLKAFVTIIMRRVAVNRYHKNRRKAKVPSELTLALDELEFLVSDDSVDPDFDAERLGAVISDFLRSLPERRHYIFMSRFYASEPISTIANDLGLSISMINKELAVIRSALKEKLESEGYSI